MGDVIFASADSRVVEGDDTSGVCLELVGGTASAIGCELTVTLTTMTGKAGMLTTQYGSIVYVWSGVHYGVQLIKIAINLNSTKL